jgi:anaerobic dimethyl sulfoxide reductase subunit B (iron-sulfur subunit)
MPEGYAFTHDPKRCLKCYSCETACKQWREIAPGTIRLRWVYEDTAGEFPAVTRTFHSVACQHCPDPPCIAVCAPGAITKRPLDGVMTVDPARCDGCRECLAACPFGAPQFDQSGIMHLCDLCSDRLAQGKQPICTDVCPTQALRHLPL